MCGCACVPRQNSLGCLRPPGQGMCVPVNGVCASSGTTVICIFGQHVPVKLKVRLPALLRPVGGCLCLMTRVCWCSLCACPSPAVGYHRVLRVCLGTCQATLRVSFSVCLTVTVPSASEQRLSCSDSGTCSSGQCLSGSNTGLCVSHSDTAPVPKTSAWVCLAVSLSHTPRHTVSHAPQDGTCPYIPMTRHHGPQFTVTTTHPRPTHGVSPSRSHAPQTPDRATRPTPSRARASR